MNARIRSRIGPKYWSSSSWPLGDGAPNSVRPVSSRSGRCSASRRSTRKYSCSGPMFVKTRVGGRVAEPAQDAERLLAERLLRAEQRDLVVERLAGERHERRRDRQRDAVRLDLEEDRAGDVPARCSRAPRRWPGCRPTGTSSRPARPGPGSCPRTRRSSGRRRSASGTSRASRRWSRSSARTSACSGSRRGPWPTPSRRGRRRRRSPGRTARGPSIVRRSFLKIGLARYWRWAILVEDVLAVDVGAGVAPGSPGSSRPDGWRSRRWRLSSGHGSPVMGGGCTSIGVLPRAWRRTARTSLGLTQLGRRLPANRVAIQ